MSLEEIKKRVANKRERLAGLNLDPSLIENLGQWLRMELTYTSNALEGNTLTRQETRLVVEENIAIGGKSIEEMLEVKNHAQALELVQDMVQRLKTNEIAEHDILAIHNIILKGINDYEPGKYRNLPARIFGSLTVLPNYMKISQLMTQLFSDIASFQGGVKEGLDLAIEVHYRLVTIHPFADGNGRTARLLFNLILLQNSYPLTFIKKEERGAYLSALEKAQTGGSLNDYTELMYLAVERSLDIYLDDSKSDLESKPGVTTYKIGTLAKATQEEVSTIRYWTQLGLLDIFNTTKSGYALYSQGAIDKAKQIRHLQQNKRLSLEEIKKLIK